MMTRSHAKNILAIREYKESLPCMDCGIQYRWYQTHFDHREPRLKKNNISKIMDYNIDVIKAEITKCDLVCMNCHAVRTNLQFEQNAFGLKCRTAESLVKIAGKPDTRFKENKI